MLGTLYELETPEIINPHDKEKTEEEILRIDEDPFVIKPQTQLGEESGSGSKDILQTPQNKGEGTEEQPQTPQKQKKDKPLPQKRKKVQISPEPDPSSSSSSSNDEKAASSNGDNSSSDSEESRTESDTSGTKIWLPDALQWRLDARDFAAASRGARTYMASGRH